MTPRALRSWLAASRESHPVAVVLGGSWSGLSFAPEPWQTSPTLLLESDRFLGTHPLPMLVGLWRAIRLLLVRTYARRGA